MSGLVRITTQIGYFVIRAWRTEGIRPGIVGVSHHMGRWRLDDGSGHSAGSSALAVSGTDHGVRSERPPDGQARTMAHESQRHSHSNPPIRTPGGVRWSDAGVHQNLTFPVQPDPISGDAIVGCSVSPVARSTCRRSLRRHRCRHRSLDGGLPANGSPRPVQAQGQVGCDDRARCGRPSCAARRRTNARSTCRWGCPEARHHSGIRRGPMPCRIRTASASGRRRQLDDDRPAPQPGPRPFQGHTCSRPLRGRQPLSGLRHPEAVADRFRPAATRTPRRCSRPGEFTAEPIGTLVTVRVWQWTRGGSRLLGDAAHASCRSSARA